MLINLSNHPSSLWLDSQTILTKNLWNGVTDIEFPNIEPELSWSDVMSLVNEYFNICVNEIAKYNDEPSAFHIMGESVFCFNLILKLKQAGYRVVASTTHRDSFMIGEHKVSTFNFVNFRDY